MAKLVVGINDLATVRPDLVKEWDYEANYPLTPQDITARSGQKVWWKLHHIVPDDYPVKHLRGKEFDFTWEALISNRTRGALCPYFLGQAVWKGFNDFATINPELAKQWDYEKNYPLTPQDFTAGSQQKIWWIYSYDVPNDYPVEHLRGEHFCFKWKAEIRGRTRGKECPYISGKAVWKGFNDLATVNPELAKQWDYEMNYPLTPQDVLAGSKQKVHWIYSYDVPDDYPIEHLRGKHFDFKWEASIFNRIKGRECPYLSGHDVWKGFNDLATVNPELAKQWDYEANYPLTPQDVTAGSNQKVWWKIYYDNPSTNKIEIHKWPASINSRKLGCGCPSISVSKGEQKLHEILQNNKTPFVIQHKYPDCTRTNHLPFDVLINNIGVVEHDGIQHFRPVDHFGGKEGYDIRVLHDSIKTKYCEKHSIPLLRIRYDQYDHIEEMVNDFITHPENYLHEHNTYLTNEGYYNYFDSNGIDENSIDENGIDELDELKENNSEEEQYLDEFDICE